MTTAATDTPMRKPGLTLASYMRPKGPVSRLVLKQLDHLLGLASVNQIYGAAQKAGEPDHFASHVLQVMKVDLDLDDEELSRIPQEGPLLIIANHPFGALDGLALLDILARVRDDVKLFANHLLRAIPELGPHLCYVDPFGGETASSENRGGVREAIRWVRDGGCLAMFPAGEVSHTPLAKGAMLDSPWTNHVARLVRLTGTTVVPIYFHGTNSRLFQLAGMIHPRLRTALLAHELANKRNCRVSVCIGEPLAASQLMRCANEMELTDRLRIRVHLMAARDAVAIQPQQHTEPIATQLQPISPAEPADVIRNEIEVLSDDQLLADNGSIRVIYARGRDIPRTLNEIGRLREITFRAAGEGSGRARDIDQFDEYYFHLFAWNHEKSEIVGAYRLGLTDEILEQFGTMGLYTSTLFRFRKELMQQINPAIELGRSFIRSEYQKEYAPLMMLWKGVGAFVVRHPTHRRLFGVVSISNRYSSVTRELLARFLTVDRSLPQLAKLVQSRQPLKQGKFGKRVVPEASMIAHDMNEFDRIVAQIESDRKGLPVLLRQYLRLNAKVLGFNVDPAFGDVLDALMLCDLTEVSRPVLDRYLGRDKAKSFLAYHGIA